MSDVIFKFFKDPDNFSYKTETISPCSICSMEGLWFDAGGFIGENEIECICDICLHAGKLKELEIATNEAMDGTPEQMEEIMYMTPGLPTWQEHLWPYIDNRYCVFERMASKEDFENQTEFENAVAAIEQGETDMGLLWSLLPDKTVKSHIDGNYNVSVYLFTCGKNKYCTWDAS